SRTSAGEFCAQRSAEVQALRSEPSTFLQLLSQKSCSCSRKNPETTSLHIGVRTFTAVGDETVDPGGDNRQRYRAELKHGIVERADVEVRSECFLRFFTGAHDRELAHIIRESLPGPGNVAVHLRFDLVLG